MSPVQAGRLVVKNNPACEERLIDTRAAALALIAKMNWLTILLSYTLTLALVCLVILVWLERK